MIVIGIPKIYVEIARNKLYCISNILMYDIRYNNTVYSNPVITYVNATEISILSCNSLNNPYNLAVANWLIKIIIGYAINIL